MLRRAVRVFGLAGVVSCQAAAVAPSGGRMTAAGASAGGGAGTGIVIADAAVVEGGAAAEPAGAGESCATQVHRAEKLPVDLLLLVDASASMDELSGTQSKWEKTRTALGAFVRDPGSVGLGVGLLFFPSPAPLEQRPCHTNADCVGLMDPRGPYCSIPGYCFAQGLPLLTNRPCAPGLVSPFNCPAGMQCRVQGRCSTTGAACVEGSPCPGGAGDECVNGAGRCRSAGEGCSLAEYGKLDVEIGELGGQSEAVVAALAGRQPDGATPMALAAESALATLQARQASQPQRRAVLVLATDGLPSGCGPAQSVAGVVSRLTNAKAATPSVPTYVVGVFAPDEIAEAQAALAAFATAGGTKTPFILTTGDNLSDRLLDALKEIRGQAVACDYGIPRPQAGALDFDKVNVRTTSAGATQELGNVAAADRCSPDKGGWYYDPAPANGTAPTRLVLCPQSCDRLRGDANARVEVVFGCATRTIE
jgi:hypothetical protein